MRKNELADGLDDEKRLYKAELCAGRKVKAIRHKKKKDQSGRRDWTWRSRPQL